MKRRCRYSVRVAVLSLAGYVALCLTSKILLAQTLFQDHRTEIAEVASGTRQQADASWWGFNKEDATDCLQKAIDSKVPKLIVDNTGSDWIIDKPIQLISNQEIVFADGVVVQAKKDCFKGGSDSLFNGTNLIHITLRGEGKAILRMRKEDYEDPGRYAKAEWRNGISLSDCSDVTIRHLTVMQTGGDGLYLGGTGTGYNKNVLVDDMDFEDNYRNGISVISADGLIIRRSRFANTSGTPPELAVDFEPNEDGQRLSNCVLEDCVFTNNKGGGVSVSPLCLDSTSHPLSITLQRNIFNGGWVEMNVDGDTVGKATVTGNVQLTDCKFMPGQKYKFLIRDPVEGGFHVLLQECIFNDAPAVEAAPVVINCYNPPGSGEIGNISFEHTTINDNSGRAPLDFQYSPGKKPLYQISNDITGDLYIENNGRTGKFDLASFLQQKKKELPQN